MSADEWGGERGRSSSFLDADANDDDEGQGGEGDMLSSPREPRAGYASSFAATSRLSMSSALTPSYSNRSQLVACEIEEICSVQWLPRSSTSSTAGEERDEGEQPLANDMPSSLTESYLENYSENYSVNRNILLDDSGVQSICRPDNSERDESSNKGGISSYFRKKSKKGKKTDGFVARIYMRFWGKKNKRINDASIDQYLEHEMGPRRFTYKELANATNNFSSDMMLGRGGFGVVYKGFLKDVQKDVAIKKISKTSHQGEKEYLSEIKVLGQLRHKNLVPFVGWCHEHQELLLVYDFMPNGSLHAHLYSNQTTLHLDWKMRYHIVLGLASALHYLHNGWTLCVLHRDIKPSNVLLDSTFNARLTDFGLARLINSDDDGVSTNVVGTFGYLDPEYMITGRLSKESDIYSFGIVLLEIACGRRSFIRDIELEGERHLVEWVWNLHGMGLILGAADKRLNGKFNKNEMESLLLVGLWCCHPDKGSRPNASQVVRALNFEIHVPTLPLTRPVAVYSSIVPHQGNSFSDSSISRSFSHSTVDSFKLPESSADHTQLFAIHPQTDIHTMDHHAQASSSQYKDTEAMDIHPQTSTSGYQANTKLACQILTDAEIKCEYPFYSSVPTTALAHEEDQRALVEVAIAQETFDVGISTNYTSISPLQSLILPGSSSDHKQMIEKHPQTSVHIMDEHAETGTSEYKDNTTRPYEIPADDKEKCEYPVRSSVPTMTLANKKDQRANAEVTMTYEAFEIGISANYTPAGPFQSYQLPIIKGLMASLLEILKSEPKFDYVMDSVRKFTSMLAMVGAPLDDWNSLAQYVLRTVKEIDNLKFKMKMDEADPSAGILSYLLDEIDVCKQASEDDSLTLVNSHQQLHRAIQEHVSLTAKYNELHEQLLFLQKQIQDTEDICFSALEEVNVIETRRAWNETRLESLLAAAASATQKLELEKEECKRTISSLSESMMSKISSFSLNV